MNDYFYDLHIHSCLSPCADDDMTPANIAGMASIQGLQLVALTDHNSSKNCPAFFHHARKYGIVPVPGMELTTAEDVHVICLFPELEDAMAFDSLVETRLIKVENNPDIFGHQYVMDEEDRVVREYPQLLINATDIPLEEAYDLVISRGGACYPAHVDRESNGMIAVLGDLPDAPDYTAYELNLAENREPYLEAYPKLRGKKYLVSSDSHHLWTVADAIHALPLEDEPYSSSKVRRSLVEYLRTK